MSEAKSKSIKNIVYGFLGQLVSILFGLLVPRLILLNYGSEANGLTASISQIFAYVALLEAGVGGATLQALYKPVGQGDQKSISEILTATHFYYKRTGYLYIGAVIILSIVYPLIIKNSLGYWTVFGVILFNGLGGAINYLFQGKYYILLQAEGKNYIKTNLTTIVYIGANIAKIVLCFLGFGIVTLQVSYFVLTLLQMGYVLFYVKKHYKWLNLKAKADYEAISQKNSVMLHQISSLIFGNTDSIILTIFDGLKVVSVYSLIGSLITYINTAISNISNGIVFNLGQSFLNNRKKFDELYESFEVIYYTIITFCLIMIYIFLNPFLSIYTRGINDISYVDKYLPVLFVISNWLSWIRVPSIFVINNCAGHFRETQWRSVVESLINIIISLIAVVKLGIYGVLIGTIIALLYRTNDMIIYSSKKILKRSLWSAYKRILANLVWMIMAGFIGERVLREINNYAELFFYAIIWGSIIFAGTAVINFLLNRELFIKSTKLVLKK